MILKQRGSQTREDIADTTYTVVGRIGPQVLVNEDGVINLYSPQDDHAGYVLVIDGIGHEFVRTALPGDLWWAGISKEQLIQRNQS